MKADKFRTIGTIIVVVLCVILVLALRTDKGDRTDTVEYKGETYCLLEYPADIFVYDLKDCIDCEVEEMCPLESQFGTMIYMEGDLYCHEDAVSEAVKYYSDDANYDWNMVVEKDDEEITSGLSLSDEDLAYIYGVEDMERSQALFFDEIEQFGRLEKVSKDDLICGHTQLAYYEGNWCWRSEVIDESREIDGTWPEYVQVLPML